MAERTSSWQRLKKRWIPVAFLAALGLIGAKTCATESHEVTVELRLGDRAPQVRSLRAELVRGDEVVSQYRRNWDGDAPRAVGNDITLDAGDYTVRVEAVLADGTVHREERRIHVDEDGVVIGVDLRWE